MIPVVSLSLVDGENAFDKWDAGLLIDLLFGDVWDAVGFPDTRYVRTLDGLDGAIVVLPGGVHRDRYDDLNAALAPLEWVLLIVTADEGSLFEAKHVHHPNLRLWVMTPRPGRTYPPGTRFIGEGFARGTSSALARAPHDDRSTDVWFAGQNTHARRRQMVDDIAEIAEIAETDGFAQGLDRAEYLAKLADTKVAPCPSGPVTPDSFRLYEALEAGCLPVADGICSDYDTPGYWDLVAPGHPFPVVDGDDWATTVGNAVNDWPGNANHAFGWWQAHKRRMAYWLVDDLTELGAPAPPSAAGHRDLITAIVCTSPLKSHPSTAIIEQTVASIREQLPDVEILLGIDGIRPEQEPYRERYEEYTRRLLWLCNHEWHNVLPMVFGQHVHQSGQAVAALAEVRTPYVFYVEGDLPITGDIPFDGFVDCLADGTADLIRLTVNTDLEPSHMHLMLDDGVTQTPHGVPLTRTVQWSQQPHLASTSYYRHIFATHFREGEATYIEWRMHSVCAGQWHKDGTMAWFRNRLWIYTPPGDMRRVVHLDGRDGDPVFDA